jgi:hypothetical protein
MHYGPSREFRSTEDEVGVTGVLTKKSPKALVGLVVRRQKKTCVFKAENPPRREGKG